MIIYYSGEGSRANPEITLGDKANLMLTFYDMREGKPTKRFQSILEAKPNYKPVSQAEFEGVETKDIPVGKPNSHFLDSGSFTLWTQAATFAKENKCGEWEFYDTQDFWEYMKAYCAFLKKYKRNIDRYTSVDVLPFHYGKKPPKGKSSQELTWRNQQWLEHRLRKYIDGDTHHRPVPVVHYGTPIKWLKHYLANDYTMIGLGGLVGSMVRDACKGWTDRCFDLVCNTPDRTPAAQMHGFGITGYGLLMNYPWYSIDSTSWAKLGGFGSIYVPHKRRGKFIFNVKPHRVKVSNESPFRRKRNQHYINIQQTERRIIGEWLDEIQIPLGKIGENNEVLEYGVTTRYTERQAANLLFFERMLKEHRKYPWSFQSKRQLITPFGLACFKD